MVTRRGSRRPAHGATAPCGAWWLMVLIHVKMQLQPGGYSLRRLSSRRQPPLSLSFPPSPRVSRRSALSLGFEPSREAHLTPSDFGLLSSLSATMRLITGFSTVEVSPRSRGAGTGRRAARGHVRSRTPHRRLHQPLLADARLGVEQLEPRRLAASVRSLLLALLLLVALVHRRRRHPPPSPSPPPRGTGRRARRTAARAPAPPCPRRPGGGALGPFGLGQVDGARERRDVAVGVLLDALASDVDTHAEQAHLLARRQPEELRVVHLRKSSRSM